MAATRQVKVVPGLHTPRRSLRDHHSNLSNKTQPSKSAEIRPGSTLLSRKIPENR